MNREFISKMIQAKKLEIEAISELLPEKFKRNAEEMGDAMKEFVKECVVELYFSAKADGKDECKKDEKEAEEVKEGQDFKERKKSRKITIE